MRTHIFIALIALVVSACASKQHPTAAQWEKQQNYQELQTKTEFLQADGRASSVR